MAEKNIDLKQKVGNDFVDIHPTTKWANIKDKPTTFTPTKHEHPISEVTNLQETINLLARTDLDNEFNNENKFKKGIILSNEDGDCGYVDFTKYTPDPNQIYKIHLPLKDGVVALKQEVEDAFDELATLMEGV